MNQARIVCLLILLGFLGNSGIAVAASADAIANDIKRLYERYCPLLPPSHLNSSSKVAKAAKVARCTLEMTATAILVVEKAGYTATIPVAVNAYYNYLVCNNSTVSIDLTVTTSYIDYNGLPGSFNNLFEAPPCLVSGGSVKRPFGVIFGGWVNNSTANSYKSTVVNPGGDEITLIKIGN